jgi:hypothetical protein
VFTEKRAPNEKEKAGSGSFNLGSIYTFHVNESLFLKLLQLITIEWKQVTDKSKMFSQIEKNKFCFHFQSLRKLQILFTSFKNCSRKVLFIFVPGIPSLAHLAAGSTSSLFSTILLQPLDVIKTKQQQLLINPKSRQLEVNTKYRY